MISLGTATTIMEEVEEALEVEEGLVLVLEGLEGEREEQEGMEDGVLEFLLLVRLRQKERRRVRRLLRLPSRRDLRLLLLRPALFAFTFSPVDLS